MARTPALAETQRAAGSPAGGRILLIDDDAILSDLLALRLNIEGHYVTRAANGAEAIRIFSEAAPDLIILDLMMPVLDGPGFLDWIRVQDLPRPYIMVLSAAVRESDDSHLKAAGVGESLRKPIALDDLLERIDAALNAP